MAAPWLLLLHVVRVDICACVKVLCAPWPSAHSRPVASLPFVCSLPTPLHAPRPALLRMCTRPALRMLPTPQSHTCAAPRLTIVSQKCAAGRATGALL